MAAPAADDLGATARIQADGAAAPQQRLFRDEGQGWQRQRLPQGWEGTLHEAQLRASGSDNVWLCGVTVGNTGTGTARMARWDGSRWTTVPLPAEAEDIDGTSGDDLWAVGLRDSGPGVTGDLRAQPAAMHWDGRGWKLTDTPGFPFPDLQPAEAWASLLRVLVVSEDMVRAFGSLTFNHGESGGDEPGDEPTTLGWSGSRWTEQKGRAAGCAKGREPEPDGQGGMMYRNRWHFTSTGLCRKTTWAELPSPGGITDRAQQSLWFEKIVVIPGTRKLLAAGHVEVNQSGSPLSRPVLATLRP